jgi:hypothetical protein
VEIVEDIVVVVEEDKEVEEEVADKWISVHLRLLYLMPLIFIDHKTALL